MKVLTALVIFVVATSLRAESVCDIRMGESIGIKVVEFATGHVIHSKMPIKEISASALREEMINLQEMGICEEKILGKKCVLKIEKIKKVNQLTFFRADSRWFTWNIKAKRQAQDFIRDLQKIGFCS
jgi:hypothetical protein